MCRNIKTLFNFEPPATKDEIHSASLQFVRKLSGFTMPSKVNEEVFNKSVNDIAKIAKYLVDNLETHSHPRDRAFEAEKARLRAQERFGIKH